jgi:hypothetical protein
MSAGRVHNATWSKLGVSEKRLGFYPALKEVITATWIFVHIFCSPGVLLCFYQRASCDEGEGGFYQIDESPLYADRGPPYAHVSCTCAMFSS